MTYAEYDEAYQTMIRINKSLIMPSFKSLERGGIVGEVELVDCVIRSDSPWFFGEYGFVLQNPKPLTFRPYRGQLGFFNVTVSEEIDSDMFLG
jgi:hypothetical protein